MSKKANVMYKIRYIDAKACTCAMPIKMFDANMPVLENDTVC